VRWRFGFAWGRSIWHRLVARTLTRNPHKIGVPPNAGLGIKFSGAKRRTSTKSAAISILRRKMTK
jgi:hypothetical protein